MPSLHILVTSLSETVSVPSNIDTAHLHLKMVSVKLDAVAADDNNGVEIKLPWLRHFYQFNSTSNRPNIVVPISNDTKTTTVYPDVVFVGEPISSSFTVSLQDPDDGTAWSDSGGATVQSVHLLFEYSVRQ